MIAAAVLGLVLLILVPAEALWRDWSSSPPRSQMRRYGTTIAKALALLLGLLWVAQTNGITANQLGLGTKLSTGGWIGLAIALMVACGLAVAAVRAKPDPKKLERHRTSALLPNGPRELRLFLLLVPLIGFAWELLYRGFLLWWLVPITGTGGAILLASLAYGLAHGWKNARESAPSIVSALLFTTGYALTGSLWWLIIIHIALPLIGYIALRRATTRGGIGEELRAA